MKKPVPDTYILPSCFASALINNDWSAFQQARGESPQADELRIWLEKTQPGSCVGCGEEAFFVWGHDMNTKQGASVLEFYFLKYE